jgi:hypothetical protein
MYASLNEYLLKFITYHVQPLLLLVSSLQKIEPFIHNCSFNYFHTIKQYKNIILLQAITCIK